MSNIIPPDSTVSVIGVCGINGNLIARILSEHGIKVLANDMVEKKDCKYINALKDYPDIEVFYGKTPERFFTDSDFIVLPEAVIKKKTMIYHKVLKHDITILSTDDIFSMFDSIHPVICVTGTNGKTTTVSVLKHIVEFANIKPSQHLLFDMQGNSGDIPPLQARLKSDVNILETGTFGNKGELEKILRNSNVDCGIITNITPDHLSGGSDFLDYAHVKAEFIEALKNKTLIINADDPTIVGLIDELNYKGNLITFGLNYKSQNVSQKKCVCKQDLTIHEYISGVGKYSCSCGIKNKEVDYEVININDSHNKFTLKTPTNQEYEFRLKIQGLHNIYNITGAIIVAFEILKLDYDTIREAVLSFGGVNGRMEKIAKLSNKEVMIDFAHNPAGITTVLSELKNSYNTIVNVITTSSESGIEGDNEILNSALVYADFVIPASFNAYICAKEYLKNNATKKIILPEYMPEDKKVGTLGATLEQVLIGLNLALSIDCNLILCTGEAAFKNKDALIEHLKKY